MNYFNVESVGYCLCFSRCLSSSEIYKKLLVNNVRIVYTYICCSRILGGQNTSASLRKILADALQALPHDDRTKQRSGVEVFTVSLRQCSRTADRVPNAAPSILFSLPTRCTTAGEKMVADVAMYKNIPALKSEVVIVSINAITKKLHFYILFTYN